MRGSIVLILILGVILCFSKAFWTRIDWRQSSFIKIIGTPFKSLIETTLFLAKEKQIERSYSLDLYTQETSDVKKKEMTFGKRLLFWLPTILTAIIACLDYIPLARLSMDLFPDAAGNIYTYFFPARMMNAVFLWAVVNGAIGLVVWSLTGLLENVYYIIHSKITKT